MKFRRWAAVLLAVWLLWPLAAAAKASETPDFSRKGSITVEMVYDGKDVTGGTLSAYYVGSIQGDRFVKTSEMAAFPGSYDKVSDSKLAEEVAAYVKEHSLPACTEAENKDGKAVFSNLELGLYLIVQTESSKGFDPVSPFLVTVPMDQDGQYVYDVSAKGKFQLHKETVPSEPTKPTTPTGDKLPQTGQLNWPVPVMAAVGLLLFTAGWMLRFGQKQEAE